MPVRMIRMAMNRRMAFLSDYRKPQEWTLELKIETIRARIIFCPSEPFRTAR